MASSDSSRSMKLVAGPVVVVSRRDNWGAATSGQLQMATLGRTTQEGRRSIALRLINLRANFEVYNISVRDYVFRAWTSSS